MAIILTLVFQSPPAFSDSATKLESTILELEERLDARIGVLIRDSASGWNWGYRENERFLMASTFKSVLCGAILDRADQGKLLLDEQIAIRAADILSYAPVTEKYVGQTLSVGSLCFATLDMSDNTAANLLITRLGGPQEVNVYLREIGDSVTRLDRMEPGLNIFAAGDPRDTSSPAAMLSTWEQMLLGSGLAEESRVQLAEWMGHGGVTGAFIRANVIEDWQVADKSGGGRTHTRNLVAMITPPQDAPYFVAIFVSDTLADWPARNAAVREIGGAVIMAIEAR